MTSSYKQHRSGDWFPIKSNGALIACCDCGLVHEVRARVRNGRVEISARRKPRNTAALRSAWKRKGEL